MNSRADARELLGDEPPAGRRLHRRIELAAVEQRPLLPRGHGYKSTYTHALQLEHHVISGAGHITIEDAYRPWPAMLDWCLTGDTAWNRAPSAARASGGVEAE